MPNTYRAINRMNGIVTMIEYTSEDDIKAYELEPTYRELGGGDTYLNPKISLTITEKPAGVSAAVVGLILIDDNKLIPCTPYEGSSMTTNRTYTGYALFMNELEVFYSSINYEGAGATYTYELDNCTVIEEEGSLTFVITDPSQDASVSLTFAS